MIKNIVGKLVLCCMISMQMVLAVDVTLQVCAMDGSALEQIGVGQPFIIQVTISGIKTSEQPQLYGTENLQITSSGYQVKMVNGISDSVYKYRATADKEGSCTIGPAVVYDRANQYRSNSLTIQAGKEQKVVETGQKKAKPEPKLVVSLDKDRVYKGQKVTASVRFYRTNDVDLDHIDAPSLVSRTDLKLYPLSGPYFGSERKENKVHHYVEWQWEIYPQEDGTILIPAFSADFILHNERARTFGALSSFFALGSEKKRMYSNTVKLHVLPLPPYEGDVHAVGVFQSYSAQLEPAVAKVGDGLILTRELVGHGSLKDIVLPEWQHMPARFRCYESKTSCTMAPAFKGMQVKRVEYVLQGLDSGMFEIPAQQFTYFDVNQERYITLETKSLAVSLRPVAGPNTKKLIQEEEHNEHEPFQDAVLHPIYSNQWWPVQSHYLSRVWFTVLLSLLAALWLCIGLRMHLMRLVDDKRRKKAYIHAFKRARAELEVARQKKDYKALHKIIMSMLADRLQVPNDRCTDQVVDTLLLQKGLSRSKLPLWHTFYAHIAETVFTQRRLVSIEEEQLFDDARQWIDHLETLL